MHTTNCRKFNGEIENYLAKEKNIFESRFDRVFRMLRVRTQLRRSKIRKKDGYRAGDLLFLLTLLPLLKIATVHRFCQKSWDHWCLARKDAFYRFKQMPSRWRSFMYKVVMEISVFLDFRKCPLEDRCFVIDDTITPKRGRNIENVSFIYDHTLGRSVLGYCIVTLGLFTGKSFYPLDFAYRFGKKRHPKSAGERIGDPRSVSGKMSHEAKHLGKIDLALQMIQRAYDHGIRAGYVLFDSWYGWPSFIHSIRKIDERLHVICRLKDSKVLYEYKGKKYSLSGLYGKIRHSFSKDSRTGLLLRRVTVKLPGSDKESVIVFAKGYHEPEQETASGKKKDPDPKWVAFLSTNTPLHSSSIIKKYTKRWTIEACFKESKQMLGLGKDQSNSFHAQVMSTTLSFLRYNLLNVLNEKENFTTLGELFQDITDETATITYAQRLWDFFRGLFRVTISKIFALFEIEEEDSSYIRALLQAITGSTPLQGCAT
jgi:hypothetical protein